MSFRTGQYHSGARCISNSADFIYVTWWNAALGHCNFNVGMYWGHRYRHRQTPVDLTQWPNIHNKEKKLSLIDTKDNRIYLLPVEPHGMDRSTHYRSSHIVINNVFFNISNTTFRFIFYLWTFSIYCLNYFKLQKYIIILIQPVTCDKEWHPTGNCMEY